MTKTPYIPKKHWRQKIEMVPGLKRSRPACRMNSTNYFDSIEEVNCQLCLKLFDDQVRAVTQSRKVEDGRFVD